MLRLPRPLKTAPCCGDLDPFLVHGSLGPPESSPQMACQLVQLFLHSSSQSVPILCNWPPLPPPKKMSLLLGGSGNLSKAWFLGPTWVTTPNGISFGSAAFAELMKMTTNRQTHRQTDHATQQWLVIWVNPKPNPHGAV